MFEQRLNRAEQRGLFPMGNDLPEGPTGCILRATQSLNGTLESVDFARLVWEICKPEHADTSRVIRDLALAKGFHPLIEMTIAGTRESIDVSLERSDGFLDTLGGCHPFARGQQGHGHWSLVTVTVTEPTLSP